MNEPLKVKDTLDCIGLFCPEPMFQTRTKLDELEYGESIEVLADDPAAEEDIKRLISRTGNELLKFEDNDGEFRFVIRKTTE